MQKPDERPYVVSTISPPWFMRTKQNARWPSPSRHARGQRSQRMRSPSGCQKRARGPSLIEVEVSTQGAVGERLLDARSRTECALEGRLEVGMIDEEAGAPAGAQAAHPVCELAVEQAQIDGVEAFAVGRIREHEAAGRSPSLLVGDRPQLAGREPSE